jgi:hypothetical protein
MDSPALLMKMALRARERSRMPYQWFAANLHRVREPSMRHYVRARELKAAGMKVLSLRPDHVGAMISLGQTRPATSHGSSMSFTPSTESRHETI